MRMHFPLKHLLNPAAIVLITALLSAVAWSIPSFGILRKGFTHPVQPTLLSLSVLGGWYACISCSFYLGQKGGAAAARLVPIDPGLFHIDDPRYLHIFTFFALAGMVAAYQNVFLALPPSLALDRVLHHKANDLKSALYLNYSPGLMSLRYLVAFSAPLAARWCLKHRRVSFMALLNALMLLLVSVLSARLLIVAAVLNALFISWYHDDEVRIRPVRLAVAALLFFAVLSALNITRNGDDYAKRQLSFWGAGVSEMLKYLGAPFQVSLGAAKQMDRATNVPSETYRSYVDVGRELNSNSAFIFLHEKLGYRAWPYIAGVSLAMGFLFSFFCRQGSTVFMLCSGSILYAAAELWRLDLFRQGVFITWMLCSISLPLAANSPYLLRRLTKGNHA